MTATPRFLSGTPENGCSEALEIDASPGLVSWFTALAIERNR